MQGEDRKPKPIQDKVDFGESGSRWSATMTSTRRCPIQYMEKPMHWSPTKLQKQLSALFTEPFRRSANAVYSSAHTCIPMCHSECTLTVCRWVIIYETVASGRQTKAALLAFTCIPKSTHQGTNSCMQVDERWRILCTYRHRLQNSYRFTCESWVRYVVRQHEQPLPRRNGHQRTRVG